MQLTVKAEELRDEVEKQKRKSKKKEIEHSDLQDMQHSLTTCRLNEEKEL